MDPNIVLVLDPAKSTGYCLVKLIKNISADIFEYGFVDVDTSSNYQGDHCIDLMKRVENLIVKHKVNQLAIEDYFFSNRFRSGSNVNAAFRTAIHIVARQRNLEYTVLNISSWKTFVAGRSTPTKEQKKKWGATHAKKLYMQQALWENHHFRFPNHSISQTTGKPVVFRFDIVDVVAQAVYFCGLVNGVKKEDIKMSVVLGKDVVWKKNNKKTFEYEK